MCLWFTCNTGTLHTYSKRSDSLLSAFNLTAVYCRLISNSVTVSPAECAMIWWLGIHQPEHLGFSWNPSSHWVLRITFHLRLKYFQFAPFKAHLLKLNANRKATITPSQYKMLPQFSRLTRIYGIDMSIVYRSKGFTIPPPSKRKH